MLNRLFRRGPARDAGEAMYAALVSQARNARLYEAFGAPDTVEGRFEVYTLHLVLLIDRLNAEGAGSKPVSQALFDAYVKALDAALREMGVGDLSVGKKMRKLGEALYGRMKSYQAAFEALPDETPLEDLIQRTVHAEADGTKAPAMAGYALAQRAHLAGQPAQALMRGEIDWVAP